MAVGGGEVPDLRRTAVIEVAERSSRRPSDDFDQPVEVENAELAASAGEEPEHPPRQP